jgi:hypothetical protein
VRYLSSRSCPSGKRHPGLRSTHPSANDGLVPGTQAFRAWLCADPDRRACALTDSITHAGQPPSLGGAPSRSTHRMVDRGGAVGSILPFVTRVVFDDAATRIMGEAFDAACEELRGTGQPLLVREVMAKRIIDAASAGERDVGRLRDAALSALNG